MRGCAPLAQRERVDARAAITSLAVRQKTLGKVGGPQGLALVPAEELGSLLDPHSLGRHVPWSVVHGEHASACQEPPPEHSMRA